MNEDDDGIYSGDECIVWKPKKLPYVVPQKRLRCKCKSCLFLPHTNPPPHFTSMDDGYCCSWCRLSNGKNHGKHCQRRRRK